MINAHNRFAKPSMTAKQRITESIQIIMQIRLLFPGFIRN